MVPRARREGARGFIGNANDGTAHWFGERAGRGTMPHALIGYAGSTVRAAEITVMHGGAFTQMIEAVVPEFQRQTGHKVTTKRETVGTLQKRIEGGEGFDLAILTPGAVDDLAKNRR